jgi:mono/diheme cytochrome c family protein
MKKFLLLPALLFALMWSCGSGNSEARSGATANDPDGKKLYRQNCVLCHGAKGNLKLNGAVELGLSEMTLEERVIIIKKGRNTMTPFEGRLTDEEIEAVAQYTFTFSDTTDAK